MNGSHQVDARINILLIDDEPKNLVVLETVLNDPGYHLVRAESADEALLALVADEFALIVLDIHMPVMNGFELATMIKQRKKTATVPIIFLTAYYSQDQHIIEGYETGAVDYLHKPVNPAVLRSKVSVFAELYRKSREIESVNRSLLLEIEERKRAEAEISSLNEALENRVLERTAELQKANQSLAETQAMLDRAQRAGQVGIWDWDLINDHFRCTEATWEMLTPAEPHQQSGLDAWLSCIHPEDQARVSEVIKHVTSSGDRYRDEYRVVGPAGEVRWVEAVGLVERFGGIPQRVRGSLRDVTERKQHELDLQMVDRRKDEFLAMLGHEIRNPLAPIRNAVFILRQLSHDNPEVTWCIDVLERQSEHLIFLVDDLLDVSRISRGKVRLHRELIKLDDVIQRAVETCRPLLALRKHDFQIEQADHAIYVNGDATRLSQVIANLLNNAAKYTDDNGSIVLAIELESGSEPFVNIRVRDNGRGLDAESMANMFELFFQGHRSLDRSEDGLGIGLALARILVELHAGTIVAHSAGPGQGSEFCVRLPVMQDVMTPPEESKSNAKSLAIGNLNVLVAEDNLDVAATMEKTLKLLGCQVLLAHDGPQAVALALETRPDTIILDIGLPGMNGYEVCQALRQKGNTTKIIALTGYGQAADRERAHNAGFDEHLVKPINIDHLIQLLTPSL